MADIDNILAEISAIYRRRGKGELELPLSVRSRTLLSYANEYKQAATVLHATSPQLFLVYIQLIDHSVELAMKSCLAAVGVEPPRDARGHDLIDLYRRIQPLGFNLPDSDFATLAHLHHLYSSDLTTNSKYKSRYPTDRHEWVVGVMHEHHVLAEIIEKLCHQSGEYCES